ncbi:MAG: hypothetical protein OEZ34_14645, partial [Spirochaetia bacterium]|nr:hypothetical protein [Spirochaetia bacterium]
MMYYFSIKTFFQTFFSVIFFLSVIFTGGLHAQTAVLPFHASGSTSLFSIVDAPIYLQEVFHFYFEKQKNYPLVDLHKTNAALRELNFQPENLLNRQSAGRICSSTGAEYLLTGSADFHSRSQIALSAVAYSCRSGKEVKKKEIGSVKNLQSIVSKLVNSASSYAQSKPQKTAAKNSSLNLYVILDLSGSMSFDLPQIKKALNSISEELPPGSNLDAYLLKNSRVEMMKSRGSLNEIKRRILKEKTSGKSSKNMFLQALTMVEKNFRWGGNNRLIILSDVSFPSGRMNDVESKLRR